MARRCSPGVSPRASTSVPSQMRRDATRLNVDPPLRPRAARSRAAAAAFRGGRGPARSYSPRRVTSSCRPRESRWLRIRRRRSFPCGSRIRLHVPAAGVPPLGSGRWGACPPSSASRASASHGASRQGRQLEEGQPPPRAPRRLHRVEVEDRLRRLPGRLEEARLGWRRAEECSARSLMS